LANENFLQITFGYLVLQVAKRLPDCQAAPQLRANRKDGIPDLVLIFGDLCIIFELKFLLTLVPKLGAKKAPKPVPKLGTTKALAQVIDNNYVDTVLKMKRSIKRLISAGISMNLLRDRPDVSTACEMRNI
jgi:hypothetical protein